MPSELTKRNEKSWKMCLREVILQTVQRTFEASTILWRYVSVFPGWLRQRSPWKFQVRGHGVSACQSRASLWVSREQRWAVRGHDCHGWWRCSWAHPPCWYLPPTTVGNPLALKYPGGKMLLEAGRCPDLGVFVFIATGMGTVWSWPTESIFPSFEFRIWTMATVVTT